MKKILLLILLLAVLGSGYYGYQLYLPSNEITEYNPSDEPVVYLEGLLIDLRKPFIEEDGRLLVSLPLSQMVTDAHYYWDQPEQTLVVTTYEHVYRFKPEKEYYMENGRPVSFDGSLRIENETPYISIDFLERMLQVHIRYSAEHQVMTIEEKRPCRLLAEVIVESSQLRSAPTIKAPAYKSTLSAGDVLTVYETYEHWLKVGTDTGIIGFIRKKDVKRYEECLQTVVPALTKPAAWKPEKGKINLVWEHVHRVNPSTADLEPIPGLDVVSPTWYDIAAVDGTVKDRVSQNYINWAKSHQYQIWPLITNGFDPDLTSAVLASTAIRESIIAHVFESVRKHDMDGLNIDFENVYLKDRDLVTQFIRELTPIFREAGLVVSVDVTILSSSEMWSMFYDREEIGKIVDYVAVMTYDQHWGSSPVAGSVAQYGWVENGLRGILELVPPEKVLLGLPFYTRLWEEKEVQGELKVSSRALSMPQAQQLIKNRNLELIWDESSGQYYSEYRESNSRYRIWVENERSIDLKSSLIHRYNLAGAASWRRGFETQDIWELLVDNLKHTDDYAGWAENRGAADMVF
jgi:spore germination protein YaaH